MVDTAAQDETASGLTRILRAETTLADENLLTDDFLHQLINVGEVDILVGLPTYNNAKTIGTVVQSVQSGILRWFPRERAVIINADGGSRDGTRELVTGVSIDDARPAFSLHALRTLHSVSTKYASTPAAGTALHSILAAAELLRAKACVVLSPDSENIEPEWLWRLLHPVYKDGCDLVTPTYSRHRFDGVLVTNLLYPMTRALYGLRIREPYPSEFAFSGNLGSQFLAENRWEDGAHQLGGELRFTLGAIRHHCRMSQAFLGNKHHVERRAPDLVPALRQTVGPLFSVMESDFPLWSAVTGSQPVPSTDQDIPELLEPVRVNRKRLREMFTTGVAELSSVFQTILSPSTLTELQRVAQQTDAAFEYPAELWVKTVYEFAASYQKSVMNRDHIIQALAPLFRGRACTFIAQNRSGSANDVENNIEDLCLEFERLKPYLMQMWKSGQ
jgi:glucosylglycerate synthase